MRRLWSALWAHLALVITLVGLLMPGLAGAGWARENTFAGRERAAVPVCGDFLAMAGKKPAGLEFIGCEPDYNCQIRVLRARYRVKGELAHEVESYLVAETGMQPLRFACCGWESHPNEQRQRFGHIKHNQWGLDGDDLSLDYYEVSMGSEETLHSTREQWPLITWFYVDVELSLETP